MMYNDTDNDLPPFNDPIDGDEIFLFPNANKTSSTGASFLNEDDDGHLRHQHNVVASTSSHMPVDVDELLLNSNFLEQPNCDQSEDPLFWNCKDISDDHLNEFLQDLLTQQQHQNQQQQQQQQQQQHQPPQSQLQLQPSQPQPPPQLILQPPPQLHLQIQPPQIQLQLSSHQPQLPAQRLRQQQQPPPLPPPPPQPHLPQQLQPSTQQPQNRLQQPPQQQSQPSPQSTRQTQQQPQTTQQKTKERQTRLDCPYCKRSFSKNFDLQQHMRCHTGEKPFQCIVCGRGFAQKSNVKKHMQAHKVWPEGPNNPLPPNQSSARSRNNSASSSIGTPRDDDCIQENESLQMNESSVHNINIALKLSNDRKNDGNDIFADNRYSCSYCLFNGRTYFELKSHLTIHKREKVFKCIVSSCGKTFPGSDLQGFLDHVTGHKDLIYHCHLCSGQFYSLDEFGEHQKHHSNAQIKRTTQQSQIVQQAQQSAPVAILNHQSNASLRQQNQQVTTTQSQQIQRQSNQSQQQQQAQNQQSNNQKVSQLYNSQPPKNNQKYFRCSNCKNRYTTQTALDHHLSIATHNFPCTECHKVFMCERYLRRHLTTHTTVQHVCTFCDKQFKTAAYLKMHSVVHTGEKPFRCNLCESAFNRRDKLNRHKLTHETVKKFKCPFKPHIGCTKEFNRPDKLKAHVLTHSGVRPHPCDECSRTFSRLSRLREHKKLHHDSNNNNPNLKSLTSSNGADIKEESLSSTQMIAIEVTSSSSGNFTLA